MVLTLCILVSKMESLITPCMIFLEDFVFATAKTPQVVEVTGMRDSKKPAQKENGLLQIVI